MTPTAIVLMVLVVLLVIALPITWKAAINSKSKQDAEKIGSAEEKARSIIDDAIKTAEAKKRESLLEVKEQSLAAKNEVDREIKDRRAEISKQERRIQSKEDTLDRKMDAMEKREAEYAAKEAELKKKQKKIDELYDQEVKELERISGMTSEEAKEFLLKTVQDDVKIDVAKMYRELVEQAKNDADKKAKEIVVGSIQRCAVDHVAESTISVVQLPSDEMKGRIIGREGRNIRTIETMTGVDLIIDDTPEAVVLSGFDPVRREIARIALEKLIVDGRIHPARIEEMVEKARKEVETQIREDGEQAAFEVGVHNLHPELIKLLGRMRFRTSYGQNALKHSIEVALLSGLMASECGCDVRLAKSHHGDTEPTSLIACLVQAADAISAARPGARRETLDNYTNRLKQLEDIANNFKGVDKSFAIQAGREVRVMVIPEQVSDANMVLLARDISKQIESELEYPGQIKVNVIRESRVVDYAK